MSSRGVTPGGNEAFFGFLHPTNFLIDPDEGIYLFLNEQTKIKRKFCKLQPCVTLYLSERLSNRHRGVVLALCVS